MPYKITALKDVTVRANVPTPEGHRPEWIRLKSGEVRDGLGLVWGVHPSHFPNEIPAMLQAAQAKVILAGAEDEKLPAEFLGLFKLEMF